MFKGMMVRLMGLTLVASNAPLITNIDKMHYNLYMPLAIYTVFATIIGAYITLKGCN